ncbi:ATP-binding cassette domain-containing protein [Candidatus Micrarchaeota archaeon]|nr:ATP-binding cassette domain-containing protein [Candidatus Micrarchaeota archaeon]
MIGLVSAKSTEAKNAIETDGLTKRFGTLSAVDNVSLKISKGEIFGLLGPNGAGKTTLISMLVTMRRPTSGHAKVNGYDIQKEAAKVRDSIGIVFQDPSLDEELTAYENLDLHAAMYKMNRKETEARIKEVIKMVELEDRLHNIVKTFSGGMRRRLEIARGLLHCPDVLFLDEPTIGLDPQTRQHIWSYIKRMRKEHGITIVITTHYMDEADLLCDRVAIVDHGKIIALDRSSTLKDSLGGDILAIETPCSEKLKEAFGGLEWVGEAKCHDGRLILRVTKGEQRIPKLMDIARKKGIEVSSVSLHKPTLDDVFLHYTGKTIREEEVSPNQSLRARVASRRRSG